jgi:hypothetical protein
VEEGDRERVFLEGVKDATRVLGGVSFFRGSTVWTVLKESEETLVESATEGGRPRTENLRLLTLPGMDVDILVTGGTGVAFGDLAGTTVVALDEALGFKVMVNLNVQSAFAGLNYICNFVYRTRWSRRRYQ